MATLTDLTIRIRASIDDFEAKMATVQKGIGRLSSIAQSAGQSLSTYVTLPLGLLAAGAIHAYGEIDSLTRGLNAISTQDVAAKGITGVAAIGQAATQTTARLAELQEIAKAPGIGFEQAVQGDIRLRAVGISAGQSASILKEFANAIALTGGGAAQLNSVTVQLGQMAAKGKVLAQDLRPIIEAAPAVATALQKLYGTVDSETISASLEKQGKSSKDFIASLTSALAEAPRVTGGIANTLENLQQAGTQSLAKLGAAFDKAFDISGKLSSLADLITRLADGFATLSPFTQKLIFIFGGIVAAAGPLLFIIGSIGVAVPALTAGFVLLAPAAVAAWAAVTGPIGLIAIGIIGITAAVTALIHKYDELHATVQATPLSGSFAAALRPVPDYFRDIDTAVTKTAGILEKLEAQLKAAKEARPALTSEADILASNKLIERLETEIKRLLELGVATDKASKEFEKLLKARQALNNGFGALGSRTTEGQRPQDAPKFIANPDSGLSKLPTELQPIKTDRFVASLQVATAQLAQFQLTAELFTAGLDRALVSGLADIAAGFGEGIGNILAGAGGLNDLAGIVLGAIGGLAIQVGQLAIGTGLAVLGIKTALETLNPALAIAGGIALVALGAAVKGAAKGLASGGGGGGSTSTGGGSLASSPRSSFTPTLAPSAASQQGPTKIEHVVKFNLSGSQLVGALAFETDRLGRVVRRG